MRAKKIAITIITLFPQFTDSYLSFGIIARAIKNKLLAWRSLDLRQFGLDARKTVDDRPYGGGVGMVLRADVLFAAIQNAKSKVKSKPSFAAASPFVKTTEDRSVGKKLKARTILLTPGGRRFEQKDAVRLAKYDHLIFVSGRYEGYDERITKFVDEEISIGDYVLMGGELPALVIAEAVLRNVSGVLGKDESAVGESFSEEGVLEFPQYTKPEKWEVESGTSYAKAAKGKKLKRKILKVPDVLLTGHHANINVWRSEAALKRAKKHRPDLLS